MNPDDIYRCPHDIEEGDCPDCYPENQPPLDRAQLARDILVARCQSSNTSAQSIRDGVELYVAMADALIAELKK